MNFFPICLFDCTDCFTFEHLMPTWFSCLNASSFFIIFFNFVLWLSVCFIYISRTHGSASGVCTCVHICARVCVFVCTQHTLSSIFTSTILNDRALLIILVIFAMFFIYAFFVLNILYYIIYVYVVPTY